MQFNEFHFFFSIFNVLFIAQKDHKYDQEWVLGKRNSDSLLNELCVNYLASLTKSQITKDPNEVQKHLILLASILRKQFKIRALVTRNFYFLKSINLKCLIAIIWLYAQLLKNYASQIFSMPFEYQISNDVVGKKINLTIGFPHHSFNLKKNQTSFPSSFAEYVVSSRPEADGLDLFVSLDNYWRESKKNEGRSHSTDSGISRLEFISASKTLSLKNFYERLRYLFLSLIRFRPQAIALYLTESSHSMLIIGHLIFIEKLKKCNQVLEVYILPFSDYLMLLFCKELQGQANVYYYSENMLIPPTSFFINGLTQKKFNKFEDGNYSSFYGIKRASGFVRVNNFLNKIAHDIFLGQEKGVAFIANEQPSMLGFEGLLKAKEWNGAYVVLVFDVPPESTFQQLCRSSIGDKMADIQFVSDFLNELKSELFDPYVTFMYKPKYSLTNYSNDYRALITSLEDSMGERFVVLNPYVRVGDIVEKSDLVISAPYTSTKRFAEFYGKKSLFYVPSKYRELFMAYDGYNSETIYGKNELIKFINDQR